MNTEERLLLKSLHISTALFALAGIGVSIIDKNFMAGCFAVSIFASQIALLNCN